MGTSRRPGACYSRGKKEEVAFYMSKPALPVIIRHADLDTAIAEALAQLILQEREGEGSEEGEITVMFAGEGAMATSALTDAFDDIRERCVAQGCAPVGLQVEPALRTDAGLRIWGTLTCVDTTVPAAFPDISAIDLDQEGELWTLTITAT